MVTAVVRSLLLQTTDADALVLINAMAIRPNNARQKLISQVIRAGLKGAGLWSKLDALYMTAAHGVVAGTSQAGTLNWKNPGTWTLVPTNSPVFSEDRGVKGDAVAAFLVASGYNPGTAGGNYSQNAACFGIYVNQTASIANTFDLALGGTNGGRISPTLGAPPASVNVRVNDTTNLTTAAYSVGHHAARRLSSAGKDYFKNGALIASDAVVSTGMPASLTLLASATGTSASDARVAYAYAGGPLVDAEMASLHAALMTYAQGVGAA